MWSCRSPVRREKHCWYCERKKARAHTHIAHAGTALLSAMLLKSAELAIDDFTGVCFWQWKMSLGQGRACEGEREYALYMLVCTTIKSKDCRGWLKDQNYCICVYECSRAITFDATSPICILAYLLILILITAHCISYHINISHILFLGSL